MTTPIRTEVPSNLVVTKLQNSIESLATKLNHKEFGTIASSIRESLVTIGDYFSNLEKNEFDPEFLYLNDTPRSEVYNNNLYAIYNDLKRFYDDLRNLNEIEISSYNYAQIINEELISRANQLASTVVDLNILNNLDRGDVIVAGDDFKNTNFIDLEVGTASSVVDTFIGGNGITLNRISIGQLVDDKTEVEIIPLSPIAQGETSVNTEATQENLGRFYEGNYYNFLGAARPEGGSDFNFRYIPFTGEAPEQTGANEGSQVGSNTEALNRFLNDVEVTAQAGKYVVIGASTSQKKTQRRNMLDSNPSSFWECEYVYKTQDLLDGFEPDIGERDEVQSTEITIDLEEAERRAKAFDDPGRDLIVDLILTFKDSKTINTVAINPIIFGANSFPEIVDISYSDAQGNFRTIEGWNSMKLARVITPEANEFLSTTESSALLSPNRGQYQGQGVFVFSSIQTSKVKVKIKVANPVPSIYERIYVLLKNDVQVTTTTTTQTKYGWLR